MSSVRHVIELRDDCSRELRVESNLNSNYMTVTIQDRKVILSPTAVKELWHFLARSMGRVAEEKCVCGTPGLNYAGPERDCPIHGEDS